MTKIAVLGGTGFLGARVVAALRAAGLDAVAASRRAPVRVDVTRPETFAALAPFDVVVDVSDTVSHAPDALISWCLAREKTVIEATSEAPCVERLHRAHHRGAAGRLVLGGGLFTGVSNLLAREVAQQVGAVDSLRLGVASSPLSGAGRGTIALMLRAMTLPTVRWQDGARVEEALRRGPALDFGGTTRATGAMSLAEPYMLRESTGARSVEAVFAPKPGWLVTAFVSVPGWLVRQRWYQALLGAYFTVLRRGLLARVASPVELVVEARGGERHSRRWVHARDGMAAAGLALAAMTEAVLRDPGWRGVRFIDELCALEPIVARVNAWAGRDELTTGP